MGGGRSKLWLVGGAVAAVGLLVATWFLLIGPQRSQRAELLEQTTTAETELIPLQRQLLTLRKESDDLPEYKADLAKVRKALPTTAGLSDFLRSLQAIGESSGAAVGGLIVGTPGQVPDTASAPIYELTLTVTADGDVESLVKFTDALQTVQPRAVLVNSVNVTPKGGDATFAGPVSVTVIMKVFVAPPVDPNATEATGGATPPASPTK